MQSNEKNIAKHTPGEWTISISPSDDKVRWIDPSIGFVYSEVHGQEVMEANAHLIAAAPEMFEFVQKVANTHPDSNPLPLIKEALTLIAKATGGDL